MIFLDVHNQNIKIGKFMNNISIENPISVANKIWLHSRKTKKNYFYQTKKSPG